MIGQSYMRGDYGISISQVDGFGKRPGLWVKDKNRMIKVASFGSDEKARLFIEYLEWLFSITVIPPKVEQWTEVGK